MNEGIYFGVPLLVVPQKGDQHLVAHRVSELGLGVSLHPQEVTPERLRELAFQVMRDEKILAEVEKAMERQHAAGGSERGANSILKYLS